MTSRLCDWKINERLAEPAAYMEVAAMTGPAAGFRRSRRAWMPGVSDASLRAPGRSDGAAKDSTIKTMLHCNHLLSTKQNGVEIQAYMAIIATATARRLIGSIIA